MITKKAFEDLYEQHEEEKRSVGKALGIMHQANEVYKKRKKLLYYNNFDMSYCDNSTVVKIAVASETIKLHTEVVSSCLKYSILWSFLYSK